VNRKRLVDSLVSNCASLQLCKGEFIELAPLGGCCGPFKMSGNGIVTFQYIVFEKELMEFVSVTVEISRAERIEFESRIDSTTAPERHGELVETKPEYKEPFDRLSKNLYKYFAHYVSPEKRKIK
jgi:hypothetical protein